MAESWKIVITFWIVMLYASFEGVSHAILWSKKGAAAFRWNEHLCFVVQRILFGLALMFTASWAGFIAGLFAYPFFHNGFYYAFRNQIDQSYSEGFTADSTSSTARFNFSWHARLICFIGAIAILIFAVMRA